MAIDPSNPLLNGPRRIDARPVLRPEPLPLEPLPAGPPVNVAASCPPPGPVGAVSEAEILAARTPGGSWTRATLARWGVAWPPPKGWKERLQKGLPQEPAPERQSVAADTGAKPAGPYYVPGPESPEFDSTKHGLLAPPKVTYRKLY